MPLCCSSEIVTTDHMLRDRSRIKIGIAKSPRRQNNSASNSTIAFNSQSHFDNPSHSSEIQSIKDGIIAWLEFRLKATAILPPAAAATATATAYWTFIHPLQCQEPQASVRQSVQPWASQEQVS